MSFELRIIMSVRDLALETEQARVRSRFAWLPKPLLAGASFRDRAAACIGAFFGIAAVAVTATLGGSTADVSMLIAPIGASAVLVFAVPASPLAQPWPVVGGNVLSALIGIAAAQAIPGFWPAAAAAVAFAILGMSLLRCLHPPGGGTALLGVLGTDAVHSAGYAYALSPVALNAVLLVISGWLFHRLSGHSYPHRPGAALGAQASTPKSRFRSEHIDTALEELGETFDVSREDLEVLFQLAERHAHASAHAAATSPA